jgi:large subunit ribosomal protein L18
MNTQKTKRTQRIRRHARVRSHLSGTSERPRLNVYRSLISLFAQVIDDTVGKTLVSATIKDLPKKGGDAGERKGKIAQSYLLGKLIAEKSKEKNITTVVFDRGGYRYHGRVQAFAEGARDGGLVF